MWHTHSALCSIEWTILRFYSARIQRTIHNLRDLCCHLVKITVGLLTTITLEVVAFGAYALLYPGSSVLWGCLTPPENLSRPPHLCQNGGLSVLFWIREKERSRVGGDDSHVVSSEKSLGEKRSVGRFVVVMQEPVLLSPKLRAKFSHIFAQSQSNVSSIQNWPFVLCQQSLWCQR
jgi:hypothetical protein